MQLVDVGKRVVVMNQRGEPITKVFPFVEASLKYRYIELRQILGRLHNLNADKRCDDAVIKTIFCEHLTSYMRGILAISNYIDLDKLVKMADEIAETSSESVQRAATSVKEPPLSDLKSKVLPQSSQLLWLKSNDQVGHVTGIGQTKVVNARVASVLKFAGRIGLLVKKRAPELGKM